MPNSTMFLSNLSIVDHAYIGRDGKVTGGSYNPSFLVSGAVTEDESVVVDFSTIKKNIKALIDDDFTGFDHKLWLVSNYSDVTSIEILSSINPKLVGMIPKSNWAYYFDGQDCATEYYEDMLRITTRSTVLTVPRDSIKWVSNYEDNGSCLDVIVQKDFDRYLTARLAHDFNVAVTVETDLCETEHTFLSPKTNATATFRYTHGLKASSSWGCQNIAHGHLSYVQAQFEHGRDLSIEAQEIILNDIVLRELKDVVFINTANVVNESDDEVTVSYESLTRGAFSATYSKSDYNLIVLPTETTVEYLVDYMAKRFEAKLKSNGVEKLFVSEGLSKGAVATIN